VKTEVIITQQRTAAKAAVKRAPSELVRLVEREQARPQVNVIRIFFIIICCLGFLSSDSVICESEKSFK
jgi:hypothetical protein